MTVDKTAGKGLLDSKYAQSKRVLMSTINEVRATGAAIDLDLPTIVVAGNQSSGKSSLIEAISGIKLPRAAGTCTRVPIEVRLRQDEVDWSCLIKIRKEASDQSGDDGRKAETVFCPPITDRDAVEINIRRAQLAVLNPSVQSQKFATYDIPDEEERYPLGSDGQNAFSNDVIVLEITGSDETDLTLVDLPGIIQNVGKDEDEKNIDLVKNMVKGYIEKQCLILLVITMSDDIQNQTAARLARDVDPKGKRTIGVLTKVDRVQGQADTNNWMKVIQGQKHQLAHGYYVTRQPDSDALSNGITFKEARDAENAFFQTNTPWKGLAVKWRKRLGTPNLTAFLSDQLSLFISDRLPDLEKQISLRHKEITAELDSLGKEPSADPRGDMLSLIASFETTVRKHIEGQPDHEGLLQHINALSEEFQFSVSATRPKFAAFVRPASQKGDGEVAGDKSGVDAEDDDADDFDAIDGDAKRALKAALLGPSETLYVDDMRFHVKSCRTRELSNQIPPSAINKLISRCTSDWTTLSSDLLDDVRPVVEVLLDRLIETTFGSYTHGGLSTAVSEIVKEQVEILSKNARTLIGKLVALERRPYTLNNHYLDSNRAKRLAALKDYRRAHLGTGLQVGTPNSMRPTQVATVLSKLAAIGLPGVSEADLAKLNPTDEFETELDLMAQTSAYWKVAYKRIVDNIPRVIDLEFLSPLAESIRSALLTDLGVISEGGLGRCKDYLNEAPIVVEQRTDLSTRRQRLGDAKAAIRKFKMK